MVAANIQRIPEPANPEANPTPERIPDNLVPSNTPQKPDGEHSTGKETPKRGPGRPPGSTNKNTEPKPPAQPKSPAPPAPKGKTGPPDFSEWQDFISGVVLHWLTKAFVTVMLRGIDRNLLTDDDIEDIELDDDELLCIARPFSNLLLRTGFNAKYGRHIINARDTIESAVMLFMWASRVNRIGKKYRPKHAKANAGKGVPDNVRNIRPAVDSPRIDEPQGTTQESAPRFNFAAGYGPPGTGFN